MPSHPHYRGRRWRVWTRTLALPVAALAVLTLGGCAAQMAYREGSSLVAQDKVEAGLVKLQEAVAADPGNAQYRAAYLTARDHATTRFLEQGERAQADGDADLALLDFRRVLALDPANERARGDLRAMEQGAHQAALLASAAAHVDKNEYEQARQDLNALLVERPDHERARAMLREVMEKTSAPAADGGLAKVYKQPITIEFRDAPLKQVFELISRRSGLNFVFDKDVKTDQKASIYLRNSTVESAIYFLLMTNQLESQVMDSNTILIFPNVAAKLKEYQEMVVKTFYLANADAKLVANTLKTILKSRDVVVDEKLNLLIVRDSPEAIRLAERLVALQDVPESEVMLDVEILEVSRSRVMDLGVAWPTSLTLTPLSTSGGTGLTVNDLYNLNKRTIGVSGISATINANKTDTDANLLANPRIRVRNHEKAKVVIGDKVPVITTTISPGAGGFASESVSYIDVGLTLNAEPTIYLNNEVAIRIGLEVSSLVSQIKTASGTTAYQIGTRQASTMLQLKDGENQVLAGLINNEERSTGAKVPGVGELPLLGRLFGSTHDDLSKTEIVLSITPHLIRNVQRPQASASEFSAGTESSFRRKPDLSARGVAQLPGAQLPRPPGVVMVASPASNLPAQAMTVQAPAIVPDAMPASALPNLPPPAPPAPPTPPAGPVVPNLGSVSASPPPSDATQPTPPRP
ncbi:secretin N-terminal domain-containing protein [Rugamonas sp.]|uniref:secretin N-terminal domain-containing protein n=1 Tax=Rugamonas sp. TaxID=1926287 RepID=UPI0025F3D28C|nr:secretin N-terminal domain-containing protein [Rugamonas sp.]